MTEFLQWGVGAFVLSVLLTLAAERAAPRLGIVALPVSDRWHRKSVPLTGGVAIVVATLGPAVLAAPNDARLLFLSGASLVMAVVGLVDDVRPVKPQIKLLAQILLASVLLQAGFLLPLTGFRLVDVLITLFWLVGLCNAFNLLDNMDGLATTIALVAACYRLFFFVTDNDTVGATVSAVFVGALLGFLVRNFPPAKIFMGDAGSLFLGFFLAGLALAGSHGAYSRGVAAVMVIPVFVFLIPIFDTAFVTVTRLLSGRSVAIGGRDHTSHRLVAVGLKEWQVLALLGTLAALSGGLAALSYRIGLAYTVVLLALLVIGLVLLGVYLSDVRVTHVSEARNGGIVLRLLADFQYKRQVMTLLLDVGLIIVAYYGAYLIRFEETFENYRGHLYDSLPIVLPVQLLTLAAFGLYRGVWRYTGVADAVRMVKATTTAVVVTLVVLLYTHRFSGFSRTVFILDWLVLTLLVLASRASFRFFTELFRPQPPSFRRVLVYGAGDGGELMVRELLNNRGLQRTPVGFIDDDRGKHQTRIHGLPVYGGREQLESLVRERGVSEVIVSSSKIRGEALDSVVRACQRLNVPLRRASLQLGSTDALGA